MALLRVRLGFLAVLGCAGALVADPADSDFAACVRRLGDPDVKVREAAFAQVLDWGVEDPVRVLKLLPTSHEDIEVQSCCQRLRERIPWERRYRVVAAHADGQVDLAKAARDLFPTGVQAIPLFVAASGDRKKEAADMLSALLDQETDPAVQSTIIFHIGLLGQKGVAPEMVRHLASPHAGVRSQAASTIGRLQNASVVEMIIPLLGEGDPAVRHVAVRALGAFREDSASVRLALARLAEDADETLQVRLQALHAAVRTEGEDARGLVERCFSDPEPEIRRTAVARAGGLDDPLMLPLVERMLEDKDLNVRCAALHSIVSLGGAGRAPVVARFLRDGDPRLRATAATLLARHRDKAWAPAIARLLDDPESGVRVKAARALASIFGWRLGQSVLQPDPVGEARQLWEEWKRDVDASSPGEMSEQDEASR